MVLYMYLGMHLKGLAMHFERPGATRYRNLCQVQMLRNSARSFVYHMFSFMYQWDHECCQIREYCDF